MNLNLIFSKLIDLKYTVILRTFVNQKTIGSDSAPASFFKSYAHSYTQYILYDIITQFMTLFERQRKRRILKQKIQNLSAKDPIQRDSQSQISFLN